nr:hypothetical protein Iba_scaffold29910CG0220 [Ipomoea batatas]GMD75270.1 hypothetical protein Iba_chr13aCG13310 [Ipomoea batatas]GMD88984.1 hypothetical protein Iba_chr14cCG12400 [Ipomoea batatas]GME09327.1 hypothetical protein Iba_scaffold8553CG0010 [Ipomoea batatas]GME10601.1 hypothetical protein Iba_scaffold10327CG0010 [Ipomoea batatas]
MKQSPWSHKKSTAAATTAGTTTQHPRNQYGSSNRWWFTVVNEAPFSSSGGERSATFKTVGSQPPPHLATQQIWRTWTQHRPELELASIVFF